MPVYLAPPRVQFHDGQIYRMVGLSPAADLVDYPPGATYDWPWADRVRVVLSSLNPTAWPRLPLYLVTEHDGMSPVGALARPETAELLLVQEEPNGTPALEAAVPPLEFVREYLDRDYHPPGYAEYYPPGFRVRVTVPDGALERWSPPPTWALAQGG